MKLKEEWLKRIRLWLEELPRHFYQEWATISFHGVVTKERLSYEEAMKLDFQPMPIGTTWGEKWEYGWFRSEFTLPREAMGHRIFLRPNVGGEMLVFVNGTVAGAKDLQHDGITLVRKANGGEYYSIVLESYSGHGPRLENGGPYPPERIPVSEPPKHQAVVQSSGYGIWNEDAFMLYLDAFSLYRLYESLDSKTLRAAKILEGLEKFTKVVDFELPSEERNKTYRQAREVLKPLLECVNGSTVPEYTIFGQSHLDLAWKWHWDETRRKCARTISTQLSLMEEYEEFKFLLCEPPIMENLKENYKELYDRLLEKVKEGKMIPEGGVYVESDTNLPSGESLIRQCLWGKKWFRKELNCDTKMVWLPDCFGFSGQLPQIFVGCGIKYFTTQKIARALKGCEEFPYNIFDWQGIDGTKILTHFYKKNNSRFDPYLLNERWIEDRVQQENIDTFLFPFGFGDGGGGATREMLEMTRRCKDLEGAPRTKMQSPVKFFEDIEKKDYPRDTYVGEIYLSWHRGTYTAQAKTKKGNRKAEISLREAEFWNGILGVKQEFSEKLADLWRTQLFNQFHDILPGTSITRVQEEAERDFLKVMEGANDLTASALRTYVDAKQECLTVFNSLSWNRTTLVALPDGYTGAFLFDGMLLPAQKRNDSVYVEVTIPSCGYVTLSLCKDKKKIKLEKGYEVTVKQQQGEIILENHWLLLTINKIGQITKIFEKESGTEFAAGYCNEFRMYKDVNVDYDAWEISSFYEELPVSLLEDVAIEIMEQGELLGVVRVTRKLHDSLLQQDIIMTSHSKRIDFVTKIDWQESHKLLKVAFPVQVFAEEAMEEIQFGYVKRPTHRSRRFDADRYEVCNHKYTVLSEPNRGFAVLNDCKYGVSTYGNSIELTLLRAPLIPDMYADKGIQEFTYSMYPYTGSFTESDVVRHGYELNIPVQTAMGKAGSQSFFSVSEKAIIIETIKPAEDGSNDLILRLYEAHKSHVKCRFSVHLPVKCIYETTMLEDEVVRKLPINSEMVELSFRPFEIKTVRIER